MYFTDHQNYSPDIIFQVDECVNKGAHSHSVAGSADCAAMVKGNWL